jgi:hypothetical protein
MLMSELAQVRKEEIFGAYFMSHKRIFSCYVDSHFVTLRNIP